MIPAMTYPGLKRQKDRVPLACPSKEIILPDQVPAPVIVFAASYHERATRVDLTSLARDK